MRGDFGFDSILLNLERISLKLISFWESEFDKEAVLDFRLLRRVLDFGVEFDGVFDFDVVLTDRTEFDDWSCDFVDDFRDMERGVGQFECVYLDIELWVISRPFSWIETEDEVKSPDSFDAPDFFGVVIELEYL